MIIEKPVTTFEESIEAAKIASRAIERGLFDDYGLSAEITPVDLIVSELGETVGARMRISRL